jgi:Cu/Ag efflux protein CusF
MNTITSITLTCALVAGMSGVARAQSKTLAADTITATATITAIDQKARTVTIKDEFGISDVLEVPEDVTRFSALKVGDKISVRYHSSVVVKLRQPGDPTPPVEQAALTPSKGEKPGVTAAAQQTLTVTVDAIDLKASTITVKGPNGLTYLRKVQDTKALEKLKVGDQLDITWTDAIAVSVSPAK